MQTVSYNQKRLKNTARVLLVLLAVLVLFTTLQWGIASSWGDIRITRVTFACEGGSEQGGLMFIPKGVSAENPAPAIINYHGRNNSSYNMINWAIEEARRGYIVLNPDVAGTLETTVNPSATTEALALSPVRYMNSLDMVKEISVTGHSMANLSLQEIEVDDLEFKPKLVNLCGIGGGFFYKVTGRQFTTNTNHQVIEAGADLYEMAVMGGTPNCRNMIAELSGLGNAMENNVVYGNPAESTAFQYVEVAGLSHQGMLYDNNVIKPMLDFIALSSPAPKAIDTNNTVFVSYLLCSAVCFITFLLMIPTLALLLCSLPGIYSIVNVPLNHHEGKSGKKWAVHLITDLAIPLALFCPVTMWAKTFPTDFFGSLWVNQIFLWLAACSLVGVALLIVKYVRKSKTTHLTPEDFGFGTKEEPMFVWKRILAAAGIAISVTVIMYTILDVVITTTGLDYQLCSMPGQLVRSTPERWIYTFRYMLMLIPVYFMLGVNAATTRRLKSTGNEVRDTVRAVLINILLSAGVLTALVVIQFVGIRIIGTGATPLDQKYWDAISFGWTFPCMMGTASGTTAFLHRKTGNSWVGMLTTWLIVIAMTVMQCCLVPFSNVA